MVGPRTNDNFTGFTDADIKRIVDTSSTKMTSTEMQNGSAVKERRSGTNPKVQPRRVPEQSEKKHQPNVTGPPIQNQKTLEDVGDHGESKGMAVLKTQSVKICASGLLLKGAQPTSATTSCAAAAAPPPAASEVDIDALSEFQKKQQQMEEENKQRKLLLQRALEDRTKRTREEARRLTQIEEELKKLDAVLSNDVAIIRDQIEVASHDFMETQKRYDKAERDYLEAKQCLFNQRERKEMLTSHLCAIIEQNELRKAKKLSELMEKLDMSANSTAYTPDSQQQRSKSVKQDVKKPGTGSP